VLISDTTPEAQAIQERIRRAMTGEQLLLLAWDMSLFARELARAGIRQEHPDWTEAEVSRELLRLTFLPALLPAGLP
jgi:Rv0078B-related antitoxin